MATRKTDLPALEPDPLILDELVQVVPGAYLGKVLLRRRGGDDWRLIGYFALQPPAAARESAPARARAATERVPAAA